jgi:response regulator of citrate/malate metabolism
MVVDDSPQILDMLAKAIKYIRGPRDQVVTAKDADGAMAEFGKGEYDAIFLDMILDGPKTGLDVMKNMLETGTKSRIVLLTALPENDPSVMSAISLGAFGHLRKPIRLETLRIMLHQFEVESGRLGRIR